MPGLGGGFPLPTGMVAQVMMHQQVWQGQFPPPDAVERYEAVEKGTFGRLITMAEKAQDSQTAANQEARRFQHNDIRRAHWLGFGVAALAIIAAMICVYLKEPWVAAACLGVPVLAVANALVGSARASPPQPQAQAASVPMVAASTPDNGAQTPS